MSGLVNYNSRGPTLRHCAVSSQHDALVVFEAARRGLIPVMRHRLADNEKDIHILPGSVYVWEEAHASDRSSRCLRRWTDGVKWSQSRMREPFLFYEEVPPFERTEQDRRNRARHPSRRDRVIKPNGLKKLTFSALVKMRPDDTLEHFAKWHLVCYMTQNDRSVPAVGEDELLRQIDVPDEVFYDCHGVALDNTPRQTVKWPRAPTVPEPVGAPDPYEFNAEYPPFQPPPHCLPARGMMPSLTPSSSVSPPSSPDDWHREVEARLQYQDARYFQRDTPTSPRPPHPTHQQHQPPSRREQYSPYSAYPSPPPQPRLPGVQELLAGPDPWQDWGSPRHPRQLPPLNPPQNPKWSGRSPEEDLTMQMFQARM